MHLLKPHAHPAILSVSLVFTEAFQKSLVVVTEHTSVCNVHVTMTPRFACAILQWLHHTGRNVFEVVIGPAGCRSMSAKMCVGVVNLYYLLGEQYPRPNILPA